MMSTPQVYTLLWLGQGRHTVGPVEILLGLWHMSVLIRFRYC